MRVLLISANTSESPYPLYPLGMSVVAGALHKNGIEVVQTDFFQNNKDLSKILKTIDAENPDIIGISIRNIDNTNLANNHNYINPIIEFIKEIRRNTEKVLVLGGSGFSLFPEIILEKTKADYGFVGEAEEIFLEFVQNYSKNILPDKRIIKNDTNHFCEIYPALYSEQTLKYYLKFGKTASLQTKRGCKNKCIYCSYPKLEGSVIRCRKSEEVVADIIKLKNDFGAEMIFFTDSLFNDSEKHYLSVLNEMKKQKVKISWTAFFSPENFDSRTLELFRETGLEYIELGADAATDFTLKKMGKNYRFSDIKHCIDQLNKKGVISSVYYMFGGPGETEKTVLEGIENIKSIRKTVSLIFMGIRIIPGTPMHKIAIKDKLISPEDNLFEEKYYISPQIDKNWLNQTLEKEFKDIRTCIYPPDSLDTKLKLLHSIGLKGIALDKLI